MSTSTPRAVNPHLGDVLSLSLFLPVPKFPKASQRKRTVFAYIGVLFSTSAGCFARAKSAWVVVSHCLFLGFDNEADNPEFAKPIISIRTCNGWSAFFPIYP